MTSLPQRDGGKRLGLVIDLDICVGCHAWCNGWVAPVYLALGLMTGTLRLSVLAVVAGVAAPGWAG